MNIRSDLKSKIEASIDDEVLSSSSVSGGCIADAKIMHTASGKKYFVKTVANAGNMFLAESNGLKELSKPKALRVPEVIFACDDFLVLESIETGNKTTGFFSNFGTAYAKLHRYTSGSFGFFEDNYIGASPQYNMPSTKEAENWPEFYFQKRIMAQYRIAEHQGIATQELQNAVSGLEGRILSILDGSKEPPTLLHGDLWGGNYMCDANNKAVLIDPAVYYGHREADLAMTKMFGGFTQEFYQAYQREFPLKEGWQYRENLYLLYHYLNHFNLFGHSYYGTAISILKGYIR